jgi:hypothetical protein
MRPTKVCFSKNPRLQKNFPGGSYERNDASSLRSIPPAAKKIRIGRTDFIAFTSRSP